MLLAYNRTLTPLPAAADGRMIEGRSEGQVDDAYDPVKRAFASGSLKALSNPEDPGDEATKSSGTKKSSSTKTSSSSSSSEKKSSSGKKKTSSKKADEPDEEN